MYSKLLQHSMAESCPSTSSGASSRESIVHRPRVALLNAKGVYRYTIPSFCAITMSLQHVSLQYSTSEMEENLEGYTRVGLHGLDRGLPACVRIISACLVPVSFPYYFVYSYMYVRTILPFHMQESEFSLEINIDNWEPDPHGVFVIYEWEWVDRMPSEPELTYKLCDDFSIPSQQSCSSSPLSCYFGNKP